MNLRLQLPSASRFAAVGSIVSLGAQGLLAVFLLQLFDAQAVGQFSVVSQIAFGWATLALAQSPLSLLTDRHTPAHTAAAHAWAQSGLRLLWLGPAIALALWWSQSQTPNGQTNWLSLAPWTVGIALLQMSWLLAQSVTLRLTASAAVALVRLVPPAVAALATWFGAALMGQTNASTLLVSALLGYGAGALWMLPALGTPKACPHPADDVPKAHRETAPQLTPNSDHRSTQLKLAHTAADVAVSALLAVHWQALYGSAQAGMLLVLLRVFGFMPGLVASAWAQVLMAQGTLQAGASLKIAALACAAIACMAAGIDAALRLGCLQMGWQGLQDYLWPLAMWQMAACLTAAHAHLPFAHGRSARYSWQCIGINAALAALLVLLPLFDVQASGHVLWLSGFMAVALCMQAQDFRRCAPRQ